MLTVLAPARHARLQRHGAPTTSGSGASPAPAATALSSLLDRPFTLLETTLDFVFGCAIAWCCGRQGSARCGVDCCNEIGFFHLVAAAQKAECLYCLRVKKREMVHGAAGVAGRPVAGLGSLLCVVWSDWRGRSCSHHPDSQCGHSPCASGKERARAHTRSSERGRVLDSREDHANQIITRQALGMGSSSSVPRSIQSEAERRNPSFTPRQESADTRMTLGNRARTLQLHQGQGRVP